MLALRHHQHNTARVSDGSTSRFPPSPSKSTTNDKRKSVQWAEQVQTRVIEEWSETESEIDSSSDNTRSDASSPDTMSPTQLYSTRSTVGRYTGLRRLRPSPHPHFDSADLQTGQRGQRVVATVKTERYIDTVSKMPSTRFSTPLAALSSAPGAAASFTGSAHSVSTLASSSPLRRSTDTLNESRRSSSSSSSMSSSAAPRLQDECRLSPPSPSSAHHTAPLSGSGSGLSSASRFAVSGTMVGASRLEAGLEGVCQLLNKSHSQGIGAVHVQSADPALVDIVGNMQMHLRTEFASFAWPRALSERAQETLRKISVLTLVIDVTIELVPEKEGLLRRFSLQIKSVFSYLRLRLR